MANSAFSSRPTASSSTGPRSSACGGDEQAGRGLQRPRGDQVRRLRQRHAERSEHQQREQLGNRQDPARPRARHSDSNLNTGPNGVDLTYRYFVAGDTHLGLRHFDPTTNTFGASTSSRGTTRSRTPASARRTATRIPPAGSTSSGHPSSKAGGCATRSATRPAGASRPRHHRQIRILLRTGGRRRPDGRGFATWTQNIAGESGSSPLDPQAESGAAPIRPTRRPPPSPGSGSTTPPSSPARAPASSSNRARRAKRS